MKFRLVRYFLITSLVAFIVVSISLGLLQRKVQTDAMIEQEEHQNVNLTKIISNSIWPEFDFLVNQTDDISTEELKTHPEMQRVFNILTSLLKGLDIVKVKAYNLKGRTIFSTQNSQVGEDKSNNGGFLSALEGETASALSHRDTFDAFENTMSDLDVVSSYIPVYNPQSGDLEGVLEIYSDVTHFLHDIHATQFLVLGGIMGLLGLLFIILLLIVRRASNIIQDQASENEKSRMLLAQSEKMASLGHMVASVAHELNTPLAFTRSNVELVQGALGDLKLPISCGNQIIELIKKTPTNPVLAKFNTDKVRPAVEDYEEDVSIEDMTEMLSETHMGLNQMADLVLHLKNFTRIDRAPVSEYDLNSGLQTVLYIAKTVIPEGVTVDTEFDKLPSIECMPSQLNQVFMNLITNASQAVDPKDGNVRIRTRSLGETVRVEIEDNGKGIAETDLQHIFDAYYTTKGVNEGTGLGLSIVKEIIEQHGGKVSVTSTVNVGTKFTVELPVENQTTRV